MDLYSAFRLENCASLAIVGAGGKTTSLFRLARSFKPRALVSTTTHLGAWQAALADKHIQTFEDLERLCASQLAGVFLLTGPMNPQTQRLGGLDPAQMKQAWALARLNGIPLLIEADGAKHLPLKAPAEHEPVIPPFVESVIVVAGLAGLGKPLNTDHIHRPERFAALAGLALEEPVSPEALGRVLTSTSGGLKNIPPNARRLALLTGADTPALEAQANIVAQMLVSSFNTTVITPALTTNRQVLSVHEPAAAIILAAGGSVRMGQPKLLLPWNGQPLIRQAVQTALQAGLAPVTVVTGAYQAEIQAAMAGLPVCFAHNPDWAAGQSGSIRSGMERLPGETGSVIFLLGDQPFVTPELLSALTSAQTRQRQAILAPYVAEQRSNPVLFDRQVFPALRQLQGEQGARSLFDRFPPACLPWTDRRILLDIDTPEDYQRLLQNE